MSTRVRGLRHKTAYIEQSLLAHVLWVYPVYPFNPKPGYRRGEVEKIALICSFFQSNGVNVFKLSKIISKYATGITLKYKAEQTPSVSF